MEMVMQLLPVSILDCIACSNYYLAETLAENTGALSALPDAKSMRRRPLGGHHPAISFPIQYNANLSQWH
jgi:hypothetical protein